MIVILWIRYDAAETSCASRFNISTFMTPFKFKMTFFLKKNFHYHLVGLYQKSENEENSTAMLIA